LDKTSVAVCSACGSVINFSEQRLRILQRFQENVVQPILPIGRRGFFHGTEYEVIGFLVRCDEGAQYASEEYLLVNQDRGFAWLIQSHGHWTFLEDIDPVSQLPGADHVVYAKRVFKKFESERCRVVSLCGEFFFDISVGDQIATEAFVDPPYLLLSEEAHGQLHWSFGQYLSANEVQHAFNTSAELPRPIGIGMNEPNRWREHAQQAAPIGLIAIILMVIVHFFFAPKPARLVGQQSFVYEANQIASHTLQSREFAVEAVRTNVGADVDFGMNEGNLDVSVRLKDAASGKEVAPALTNGEPLPSSILSRKSFLFTGVRAGRYLLVGEVSGTQVAAPPIFTLTMVEGKSTAINVALAIFGVIVVPIVCLFGATLFERARWRSKGMGPSAI